MKLFSSLDAKDRRLMMWCLGLTAVLAVVLGFLAPNGNGNDNRLPSSYLAGQHGARAAFETLLRANYPIERWERPLAELATQRRSRDSRDLRRAFYARTRRHRTPCGRSSNVAAACSLPATGADSFCPAASPLLLENSTSLRASLSPRASTCWQVRARCGWCPRRHGRSATGRIAFNTAARANPRSSSTTSAKGTWCGGPARHRSRTLARARERSGPVAQLAGAARRASFLLGRVAARRRALGVELRIRSRAATCCASGCLLLGLLIVFSFSRRSGPGAGSCRSRRERRRPNFWMRWVALSQCRCRVDGSLGRAGAISAAHTAALRIAARTDGRERTGGCDSPALPASGCQLLKRTLRPAKMLRGASRSSRAWPSS